MLTAWAALPILPRHAQPWMVPLPLRRDPETWGRILPSPRLYQLTPSIDTATSVASGGNVSYLTLTHVTGAGLSNALAVVNVGIPVLSSTGTITVTWGGTSMTAIANTPSDGPSIVSSWGFTFKLPAAGSTSVIASWSGSATRIVINAVTLKDVNQTTPVASSNKNNGNTITHQTVGSITSAGGTLVVNGFAKAGSEVPTSDNSEDTKAVQGTAVYAGMAHAVAGTTTVGWTWTTGRNACIWYAVVNGNNITGSGGVSFPAPAVSASGKETFKATGGVSFPAPAIAAAGKEKMTGTAAPSWPAPAIAASGKEKFTGSGGASFPVPAVSAAGKETMRGTGAPSFPAPAIAATGAETFRGSGAPSWPASSITAQGIETMRGSGGVSFPAPAIAATAKEIMRGSGGVAFSMAPQPFWKDDFGRTVSNGWGKPDYGPNSAYSLGAASSHYAVNGSAGTIDVDAATVTMPIPNTRDVEVLVSVQIYPGADVMIPQVAGRASSFTNPNNGYRITTLFQAPGVTNNNKLLLAVNSSTVVTVNLTGDWGTKVWIRARFVGASPTTISAKAWRDGDVEPDWMIVRTDSTAGLQSAAKVSVANKAVFDDLRVTDVTQPIVATGVEKMVGTAAMAWAAGAIAGVGREFFRGSGGLVFGPCSIVARGVAFEYLRTPVLAALVDASPRAAFLDRSFRAEWTDASPAAAFDDLSLEADYVDRSPAGKLQ